METVRSDDEIPEDARSIPREEARGEEEEESLSLSLKPSGVNAATAGGESVPARRRPTVPRGGVSSPSLCSGSSWITIRVAGTSSPGSRDTF